MEFQKVFHIDCSRKYFSLEELGKNNYTLIELAFSNGGMRFLLNDMEIITSKRAYSNDEVRAAINFGNREYYDAGVNEINEAEME